MTQDNGSAPLAKTTAREILDALAARGLSAADLTAAEVAAVYPRITRVKNGPDLAAAAAIMPLLFPAPVSDPIVGLIVETRCHANLPIVVRQAVATGLTVQVVHGTGNAEFVCTALAEEIAQGRVVPTALNGARITAESYNGLLLSPAFWRGMVGREKVLVFQCDTVFCAGSPYRPADFMAFDYIGPVWAGGQSRQIVSNGGIGGFTLRDHALSLSVLERFDPASWPAGEDRYFAFHLELVGSRIALPEECDRFCTQHRGGVKSLGAHKLNGLSLFQTIKFLVYCPAAWRILPKIEPRMARGGLMG